MHSECSNTVDRDTKLAEFIPAKSVDSSSGVKDKCVRLTESNLLNRFQWRHSFGESADFAHRVRLKVAFRET